MEWPPEVFRGHLTRSPSWDVEKTPQAVLREKLDPSVVTLLNAKETRFILRDDKGVFHRVSAQYYATDRHLSSFLASLIHPETKGARKLVLARMAEGLDLWQVALLPQGKDVFFSLAEAVVAHPKVSAAVDACRSRADTRVVSIDGHYSSLLGVLYQTPHGRLQVGEANAFHTGGCR